MKAKKALLSQQAYPLIFNIAATRHVNISYSAKTWLRDLNFPIHDFVALVFSKALLFLISLKTLSCTSQIFIIWQQFTGRSSCVKPFKIIIFGLKCSNRFSIMLQMTLDISLTAFFKNYIFLHLGEIIGLINV